MARNIASREDVQRTLGNGDRDLRGAKLAGANLRGLTLNGANLQDSDLQGAVLEGVDLSDANLSGANLSRANLEGAQLRKTDLSCADLRGACLGKLTFDGTVLKNAKLGAVNLQKVCFQNCNLDAADLRDVEVDDSSGFTGCSMIKTKINRTTLELLDPDYAKINHSMRIRMVVVDDVRTLRLAFSGIMRWVHFAAVLATFSPYLFVISWVRWTKSCQTLGVICEPMYIRLYEYIVNGQPWWVALSLLFILIYNILRFPLVYKTNQLEMQELSTGMPSLWTFREHWVWHRIFQVYQVGFWINLCSVGLHLWAFLNARTPPLS